MKTMSCKDLGGPCDLQFTGKDANEIIKAQDAHLKAMKGRWKKPWAGMGWYRNVKREFAALPDD